MCADATPDGEEHPENSERMRAIWRKRRAEGIASRCEFLKVKEAEEKYIASVHSQNHIKLMRDISSKKYNFSRNKISKKFDSIYFNKGSSESAFLAAGSVIDVARGLLLIWGHVEVVSSFMKATDSKITRLEAENRELREKLAAAKVASCEELQKKVDEDAAARAGLARAAWKAMRAVVDCICSIGAIEAEKPVHGEADAESSLDRIREAASCMPSLARAGRQPSRFCTARAVTTWAFLLEATSRRTPPPNREEYAQMIRAAGMACDAFRRKFWEPTGRMLALNAIKAAAEAQYSSVAQRGKRRRVAGDDAIGR